MNELKDKIINSKLFLFFLLLLLIYASIACVKVIYKKHQMAEQNSQLRAQIVSLREENDRLGALKEFFSNKNFLEKEAKQRLNLKKEGEEVVILPDSKVAESGASGVVTGENSEAATTTQRTLPDSLWKKWWMRFFE
jgi:cell division protein FtsB